jgi:CheY-like chemotaxis protein
MARILIADDDPILRMTVVEHLQAEGHEVVEAVDGREALDRLTAEPVDLLIVDMLMPNVDGLEVIMQLRRSGSTLPILAISSGGRMDRSTLLRPAQIFGANRILPKPLLRDQLVETVRSLLSEGVAPAPAGIS